MGSEYSRDDLQYKTDQEILDIYNKRERIKASAQPYMQERMELIRDNGGPRDPSEVVVHGGDRAVAAQDHGPVAKNIVINNCSQNMTLKKAHATMAIDALVANDVNAKKMTQFRADAIKTSVMLCAMGALPVHSSYDVNVHIDNEA